jgi:hypothetical protein
MGKKKSILWKIRLVRVVPYGEDVHLGFRRLCRSSREKREKGRRSRLGQVKPGERKVKNKRKKNKKELKKERAGQKKKKGV